MRIGMVSWESLYSVKVGGVAPHVSELSEALARSGHEVHVFTRRGDFGSDDKINDVCYQRVDSDLSGDIIYQMDHMCDAIYDRFENVQKIFGEFDIMHGHDWHPVTALNRIKADYGTPYVITLHSTEWGRSGNNFSNDGIPKEVSHREWLGGYESARVITTTQKMKDELTWLYQIPGDKIEIIPNGIVIGSMRRRLDPGRVKEKYGIHPLAPVALFCGRMSYQKGPDILVEALPQILEKRWDVKFVFIGDGAMRQYCEERTKELGVAGSCLFLGYAPCTLKEEWMNACDLRCVPSRNEPFGIVVLEAWDAAKPVVATDAVSIIKNFEDGLLAYIAPQSIAWCVNKMLQSPKEMERLSKAGRKTLVKKFSWDNGITRSTEEVYMNILGSESRSRSDLTPESVSKFAKTSGYERLEQTPIDAKFIEIMG
jgi:glycosyltransferase involved in cell wall biosynthesis